MVDDTYYITPHEAALAVVATAMKKSRLPFHVLVINSIIGSFLFSAGGMLYVMCEATSVEMRNGGLNMFVTLCQGAVYGIGLFYVIVCGMELFNSNILFFSTGVMRGAVTLMDLIISWWVSFWVNLAGTIFVVFLFCHVSKLFQSPEYIVGTIAISQSKDSFSFMETFLKGVAGNFFVCLAVYLQIMVKPLHVKFLMIILPIFTFVAMGFTHVVADMFLVPAGIFNNCGYGFGHYFWKIMLPGALGNMVGGSFFGIVIPWYLHLVVVEQDMKKLNLPAYEERDEQPGLNMDSRVVRVPTVSIGNDSSSATSTIMEFKPDEDHDISRTASRNTMATGVSMNSGSLKRVKTSASVRSPRGVFPVVDMGPPLEREKTIASAYKPEANLDELLDNSETTQDENNESLTDGNSQLSYNGPIDNPYDPLSDKVGNKLMKVITRKVAKPTNDNEDNYDINDNEDNNDQNYDLEKGRRKSEYVPNNRANSLSSSLSKVATVMEGDLENLRNKSKRSEKSQKYNNALFRQLTFGGGGNNRKEIHKRISNAKITRKAAALSNDIAGIHQSTVDWNTHSKSKRSRSVDNTRRKSTASSTKEVLNEQDKGKLGVKYANDRWKHMVYDYELDSERPVSFISDLSSRHGPLENVEEGDESPLENENPQSDASSYSNSSINSCSADDIASTPVEYEP